MAWYAQISLDNTVQQVIFANNEFDEPKMSRHYGGKWLETSEEGEFRNIFAYVGCTYDKNRDVFIPPKPFASWTLNEDSCLWESPTPYPEDGQNYLWNEETQNWDLAQNTKTALASDTIT